MSTNAVEAFKVTLAMPIGVIGNTTTSFFNFPSFWPGQAGLSDWIFLGKNEALLAHFNNSMYNTFPFQKCTEGIICHLSLKICTQMKLQGD